MRRGWGERLRVVGLCAGVVAVVVGSSAWSQEAAEEGGASPPVEGKPALVKQDGPDVESVGCTRATCRPGLLGHHTRLDVQRRVQPSYPTNLPAGTDREQTCLATVHLNTRCAPYQVDIEDCALAFHASARNALLRWRWKASPSWHDCEGARTKVKVRFHPD